MQKLALLSLLTAVLCASLSAGPFYPHLLSAIPAQPGQQVSSLQVDSRGNTIVVAIFLQPGQFQVNAVVLKMDPQGNEVFSLLLPSQAVVLSPYAESTPLPLVLALDSSDNIYVGGPVEAPSSYPFTSVLSSNGGVAASGFLIKINGADGTLAYAAALGGYPTSLTVDASGDSLATLSSAVPLTVTPGAYSSGGPAPPASLMYIVRLSQAGDSILWSAEYSGSGVACDTPTECQQVNPYTNGSQILEDAQGDIWIAGNTNATALPVTPNALKSKCGCGLFSGDGFLAEFSNDGTKLLYATYVGTSPPNVTSTSGNDDLRAAAMDGSGNIWMVGSTNGSDLPVTSNAIQSQLSGGTDGFIAQYNPSMNKLLYASYFGGTGNDSITNVQIASDGTVLIAGNAQSQSLPITASGFTRGSGFLATIDPKTYAGTFLTTFPAGSIGTGLTSAPGGMEAISGTSNVVDFLAPAPGAIPAGTPVLYGITSSANFIATGQVAQGELITLFGANIGPSTPVTANLSSGPPPIVLGGVEVLQGPVQLEPSSPIPLLYVQQDQINAIVGISTNWESNLITFSVKNGSANSSTANLQMGADPEAFLTNPPYAAALNQDGTVNSQANPAAAGGIVAVFGTGLASTPNLLVLYNGAPVAVTYAGQAPMLVAGVSQVNFVVPPSGGSSSEQFQFEIVDGDGSPPSTGMPFEIWVK